MTDLLKELAERHVIEQRATPLVMSLEGRLLAYGRELLEKMAEEFDDERKKMQRPYDEFLESVVIRRLREIAKGGNKP
jgi:hypothetical protein